MQWNGSTPYTKSFTDNAVGQQTSVTKPSEHIMEYGYNKRNRVMRVSNPDVRDAKTIHRQRPRRTVFFAYFSKDFNAALKGVAQSIINEGF